MGWSAYKSSVKPSSLWLVTKEFDKTAVALRLLRSARSLLRRVFSAQFGSPGAHNMLELENASALSVVLGFLFLEALSARLDVCQILVCARFLGFTPVRDRVRPSLFD